MRALLRLYKKHLPLLLAVGVLYALSAICELLLPYEMGVIVSQGIKGQNEQIIYKSGAVMAVSIHQNSFSQSSSKGAQVFYYSNSEEGKQLANIMQEAIKQNIGDGNYRLAKENDSYYLLKKTNCPLVIVECGFLSNAEEETLLLTEEYQQKMAEAIGKGLIEYGKQQGKDEVKIQIETDKS